MQKYVELNRWAKCGDRNQLSAKDFLRLNQKESPMEEFFFAKISLTTKKLIFAIGAMFNFLSLKHSLI